MILLSWHSPKYPKTPVNQSQMNIFDLSYVYPFFLASQQQLLKRKRHSHFEFPISQVRRFSHATNTRNAIRMRQSSLELFWLPCFLDWNSTMNIGVSLLSNRLLFLVHETPRICLPLEHFHLDEKIHWKLRDHQKFTFSEEVNTFLVTKSL